MPNLFSGNREVHILFFDTAHNPPKHDGESGAAINTQHRITAQGGVVGIILYDTGEYRNGASFQDVFNLFKIERIVFTRRLYQGRSCKYQIVEVYGKNVKHA